MMTTATQPLAPDLPTVSIQTLDITVLMGGPSSEREVSLQSGQAVAAALKRLGHRVVCSDVSPENLAALDRSADLIFIALHGTFGEDGQLQAVLEERHLPYVGSDAVSSRLSMNKVNAKTRFLESGLPTPRFEVVTREQINQISRFWKLPVVLKPINGGSSIDLAIEKDAFGFQSALERLVHQYGSCLIEEYIRGPEYTVGILGEMALPICEIRTPREFYDYTAKYQSETTEYRFDLNLPLALVADIQAQSLKAHQALGCRDFSRVDWMLDAKTGQPFILEVNTIPGFTDHSLLPKAAARMNISFDQLCQRIVELAMGRMTPTL